MIDDTLICEIVARRCEPIPGGKVVIEVSRID
jgi:hypothetical protein